MSEEKTREEELQEGEEAPPPGVAWMATFRWMLLIGFGALALFMVARELGVGAPASVKEAKPTQTYTCPMHPQIVQEGPGKCPVCSMDLSPVQEAKTTNETSLEGLSEVTLSPERIQKIGLTTTRATRKTFTARLHTVGTIALDESRMSQVHSRVAGFIESIKPLRVGDFVKKGELLATLYSQEIEAAQREYLLLFGSAPNPALLKAAKNRLKILQISDAEIAALEKSGTPRPLSIYAISSGVIVEKNAVLGASVTPEMTLFTTADLSVVFGIASIPERELSRVQKGQKVTITSAALPGEVLEGEISFLYPEIDEMSRTKRARIELKNPKAQLSPGMFLDVSISLHPKEGIAIPRDALIETGEHRYVFLAQGEGRFTPVAVEVGVQEGGLVEVTKGLSEGDTVVLSAGFLLDADSRLHAGGAHD